MTIKIFNSLTKSKEDFVPIDPNMVKMYVCGPTVYNRPHVGNARSVVIYDLLFRLLTKVFNKVIYVRNITDVDDKINKAAKERNISISDLTKEIIGYFHKDMEEANVLSPTIEPRATDHIKEIVHMIEKLIKNNNAYVNDGHVLFDVNSYKDYGKLSNRDLDDMIAGSRVEIAGYKKNPLDFVLWKPSDKDDDKSSIFDSPWGKGRPGWHIECSAMSDKYLGQEFDIHGGGADLQFPHHENEIAQSICANKGSNHAKYWVHNGFLTINGDKMSKSLKNFVTLRELLDQGIAGITIRYLLLCSQYRKPLDFNQKALLDAEKSIEKFYSVIDGDLETGSTDNPFLNEIIADLSDDLNTPKAFAILHKLVKLIKHSQEKEKQQLISNLVAALEFLGLYDKSYLEKSKPTQINNQIDEGYILEQIELRKKAKEEKDWKLADKIRDDLLSDGVVIEDKVGGEVVWNFK